VTPLAAGYGIARDAVTEVGRFTRPAAWPGTATNVPSGPALQTHQRPAFDRNCAAPGHPGADFV